ncbi:MAG: hypothetical protein OXC98_00170 [bacterium]|nr:hypothetical protein [bacterium]
MPRPKQGQQLQDVRMVFNPSYAAGLTALAEKWEISPVAVARRLVREATRKHGVLDRPQRLSQNQDSEPGMVHLTLRITPMQASFLESTANGNRLSRSEAIRGVLTYDTRQPITHQHLGRAPAEKRTVRWPVRITERHNAHIRKIAQLLKCSETDAAAALLTSMVARRHFLQHLKNDIL